MAWLPLDYVLFAAMAFVVGVGLFRGLSGELGSLAGFAVAIVAGAFLFDTAKDLAIRFGPAGSGPGAVTGIAAVVDFVFGLIAYGVTRKIVARFVSFLLPQPTNALLGALGGAAKCALILGLLVTGAGLFTPGAYASSVCAENSVLLHRLSEWADANWGDPVR